MSRAVEPVQKQPRMAAQRRAGLCVTGGEEALISAGQALRHQDVGGGGAAERMIGFGEKPPGRGAGQDQPDRATSASAPDSMSETASAVNGVRQVICRSAPFPGTMHYTRFRSPMPKRLDGTGRNRNRRPAR